MSESDGKRGGPDKLDTLDTIASSRTLPLTPTPEPIGSARTVLAESFPSAVSSPRLPRDGGEVLGNRYEIVDELGRGAEGVVYRVRDLKADAVVALKLLREDEGSEERLQRFRRELQMARKVTHPNVVRIHDLVELPGRFGLTMELVDGEPLDQRIRRGKLGPDELVRLARDLAHALAAAHAAGVTHRDLKPGNVLVRSRDGQAMVTDFGISRTHGLEDVAARAASGETPLFLTREGALIGTPLYMSPEQLDGRTDVGPPADVYGFGALMYEAATGKPLHDTDSLEELRRLRFGSVAPSLRALRPDLPKRLCDAVDRSLSRRPEDRYPSGVELLAALEGPAVRPRLLAPAWLALGVVIAGIGGLGIVLARYKTSSPHGPPMTTVAEPSASIASPPFALRTSNPRRLTFGDGCEEFPSFTPDGKTVLYDGTVGRDSFIYSLNVAPGSSSVQLTHVRGWDMAASVSPKGDRIALLRIEGERAGTFVGPLDGSEPPHLVAKGAVRPSWTRDGKAVWSGSGAPLAAHDADSGEVVRELSDAPPVRAGQTMELVDGSLLATLPAQEDQEETHAVVALFPPGGGMKTVIDAPLEEVLAVSADERHAVVSRVLPTGAELLDVPLDGSAASSLASSGIAAIKGLAFSRDGALAAWSACGEAAHMVGTDKHGQLTRSFKNDLAGPSSLAAVPGTSDVVVVSTRTGKAEPWLTSVSGDAPPRAIPIGALSAHGVAVSGDGSRFAITVPGDGVYVGSLRGDVGLRRITSDGSDSFPAFTFDGAHVLVSRHPSHSAPQIMSIAADGSGTAVEILGPGSDQPAPSPVDERVVFLAGAVMTDVVPTLWDPRTGSRRPLSTALPAGRYGDPRFSADGRRALLVRGDSDIVEVDVATGAIVRTLATSTGDQLQHPTYTPAGIVALRVVFQGNVWVADVAK